MAGSPDWKVYSPYGEYRAACKDIVDAFIIVGTHGDGWSVKWDHKVTVWREGLEGFSCAESYDRAEEIANQKLTAYRDARRCRSVERS